MEDRTVTFSEAIERVLRDHGGYAPLKTIYKDFVRYRTPTGKTPFKTIQERVQRDPRFTRIGLGVYALTTELHHLPRVQPPKTASQRQDFEHTRFEGILIEIGNLDGFETYTPDSSKIFDNKRLGSISTVGSVPDFTYPNIVRTARFIDVIWFNERRFPERAFEVEYSTNFRNSLVKFTDLQDFNTEFFLVGPEHSRPKYQRELERAAFSDIASRCVFWGFDKLENLYRSRLALAEAIKSF